MKILERLAATLERKRKELENLEDMRSKLERLGKVTSIVERFAPVDYAFLEKQVIVRVDVKALKDVEPVLEILTEEFGAEFDGTRDHAALGWREFTSSNVPWIRVDAELKSEGPECRRVIVGYEQTPVYELRCGEGAATPDAPQPGALQPSATDHEVGQ